MNSGTPVHPRPRRARGRPPGPSTTADALLDAAHEAFVTHGYRGATLRSIAESAGVDAALVNYHFGSKRGLFIAAMGAALDPAARVAAALDGPAQELPHRLVRAAVTVLDDPAALAAMRVTLGAALADEALRVGFAEFVDREIVQRIADRIGGSRAVERATAVATVLAGIVFARHLVGVPSVVEQDARVYSARIEAALRAAAGNRTAPGADPLNRRSS